MSYYHTCPHCGAHLDPGESCDCRTVPVSEDLQRIMGMSEEECAAVLETIKTAQSAANALDGAVEQNLDGTVSTSEDTRNQLKNQEEDLRHDA